MSLSSEKVLEQANEICNKAKSLQDETYTAIKNMNTVESSRHSFETIKKLKAYTEDLRQLQRHVPAISDEWKNMQLKRAFIKVMIEDFFIEHDIT